MPVSAAAAAVGLLLVFFLPGFGLTRALFPEQRIFRPLSLRTLIEQVTLSLVLSVVVTIVIGFAWLGTSTGVQASWADPLVEAGLAVVAAVSIGVAALRGSFHRSPPMGPRLEPEPGQEGAFELIRHLDGIAREERRLVHRLRVSGAGSGESQALEAELARLRAEAENVRRGREEEYVR